ncbi:hypothetical protein C100_13935 [Sphingobium sp. C100]|nr:hypothetical protein C100_13935 [Sphingobium sp. C100]
MAMTLYHLNLFNDADVWDEEGRDFVNLAAAEKEAVRNARDIIAEHIRHGLPVDLNDRLEIADRDGTVLKVVRFGECVFFKR